jgi:hypothetical protein
VWEWANMVVPDCNEIRNKYSSCTEIADHSNERCNTQSSNLEAEFLRIALLLSQMMWLLQAIAQRGHLRVESRLWELVVIVGLIHNT